jgi:hypothetical protein
LRSNGIAGGMKCRKDYGLWNTMEQKFLKAFWIFANFSSKEKFEPRGLSESIMGFFHFVLIQNETKNQGSQKNSNLLFSKPSSAG